MKYREFYLILSGGYEYYEKDREKINECDLHVIEYQAYTDLKHQTDQMREALADCLNIMEDCILNTKPERKANIETRIGIIGVDLECGVNDIEQALSTYEAFLKEQDET